jgi:hypothetical protein
MKHNRINRLVKRGGPFSEWVDDFAYEETKGFNKLASEVVESTGLHPGQPIDPEPDTSIFLKPFVIYGLQLIDSAIVVQEL